MPAGAAGVWAGMNLRAEQRPRLLDLFCGAGGAAKGYQRAGFYVVGVDIKPQPRYCGDEFYQGDALTFPLDGFDAIHASPPCQRYANVTRWRGNPNRHPDCIPAVRERLRQSGACWVLESVRTVAIRPSVVLCGSAFRLRIQRHRGFETNWWKLYLVPGCYHQGTDFAFDHGGKQTESAYRDEMGCHWMTVKESREAIPPAYTEFIGKQLMQVVAKRRVA